MRSHAICLALCAAGLLPACGTAPKPAPALATAPLLRISDGDGNQPGYAYRLGRAYEQQGDLARADAAYARSLALDPDQLDARNARAVLLAKQGRLDEAAALLQKLTRDFPYSAQALGNLGYLQYLQGQHAQAAATLRAALALDPDYGPARANLSLLGGGKLDTAAVVPVAAPTMTLQPFALTTAPTPQLSLVRMGPNELRLQAAATVAAVSIASATDSDASAPECLHIVNGNGMPSGAARMRDMLRQRGFAAASSVLGNQRGYTQARTVIEYVPGQQQRASALRTALGSPATLVPVATLPRQVALRLVLGQDRHTINPNLLARQERPVTAFNQESP
ncbi:UNVERIFIED_ORG: tetratricopeptide repeat protein [Zoogloea ramigera]|uniref:Tetratricopeptide repeat protein n=1 Tax=Duganella zoogloeoides TaxID=75659 RepID=A0ABZ0Y032_9BURK|nr:LytR C-terminal domain-containing protein [Duganella zoogloeoides]WQH05380.1 tetratricopeptide repeat protein [Duganella zoogloeoides]